MKIKSPPLIAIIIVGAFLVRLIFLNFPFFTEEEARIAYRGYSLEALQTDELNRRFPLIFNSLSDYQLPVVSYLTAWGVFLFGKNDLGVRIMFIILGTILVYLIYQISLFLVSDKQYAYLSSFIVAFSPVLIFFSKIPNEFIILTFLIALLFIILTRKRFHYLLVFITILIALFTSKISWFITPPFVAYTTLSYNQNTPKSKRIILSISSLLLSVLFIIFFLQIPQGKRSFLENNFFIFLDGAFKNHIDTLRGEGIKSYLPNFIEKFFFNKSYIFVFAFIHWLSHLQLSVLFSKFDSSAKFGFSSMGTFPKILIIPFIQGLILLIKDSPTFKLKKLLLFPVILTYPIIFIYPSVNTNIIITALPFISLIIAFGLVKTNQFMKGVIISLLILELVINLINVPYEVKISNGLRPNWINKIVNAGFALSANYNIAFSDNITPDIVPFLQWYTPVSFKSNLSEIQFPYKVRQSKLGNIYIIGSNNTFYKCGLDKPTYIFASLRDEKEIRKWLNLKPNELVKNIYSDNLSNKQVYLFEPKICVH